MSQDVTILMPDTMFLEGIDADSKVTIRWYNNEAAGTPKGAIYMYTSDAFVSSRSGTLELGELREGEYFGTDDPQRESGTLELGELMDDGDL